MRHGKWLAALPFLGLLVGPIFLNRVTPFIFGLPLLLAWIVLWLLLTPLVMAIVYRLDPANRPPSDADKPAP
jgi:tellurite resistance protein TehA-like permease